MAAIRKTYPLYEFDALAADAQEKVVERERYVNVEEAWWSEPILARWRIVLEQSGYEATRILWSGFGSQGDGACFEATVNVAVWLVARRLQNKFRRLVRAWEKSEIEIVIRHTGRYCHAYSTDVIASYEGDDAHVQSGVDGLVTLMKDDVVHLSKQIYRDLDEEYSALTEDDAVAETLRAESALYHGDGCRAHG